MNTRADINMIGMLRHIAIALKAVAKTHQVKLSFHSTHKKIAVSCDPEEIITVIVRLICRALVYIPAGESVSLEVSMDHETDKKTLLIQLHVTGINLSRIGQITRDVKQGIVVKSMANGGTSYELRWESVASFSGASIEIDFKPRMYPNFYSELRRHLQSHFTKADKLLASLSFRHPKDADFLRKVNFLILDNIDKDGFNTNHLSRAIGMSRTQLYRKLQPIIQQAPGSYIQTLRIQKAKELLETTDMRIGEVSFKTGFQTPSHFSRVFVKHYGVRPSLFCRKSKM